METSPSLRVRRGWRARWGGGFLIAFSTGFTLSSHVTSVTGFLFTWVLSHGAFQSNDLKEGTSPLSQTCLLPPLWARCHSGLAV